MPSGSCVLNGGAGEAKVRYKEAIHTVTLRQPSQFLDDLTRHEAEITSVFRNVNANQPSHPAVIDAGSHSLEHRVTGAIAPDPVNDVGMLAGCQREHVGDEFWWIL